MSLLLPYETQERELVVLGSRFIAVMMPLDDLSRLGECLSWIEERYPKATHYPYAAKVEAKEKMSDDGEPSRSTGIPLLSLIHQKCVDHILLCVVRYFGGTKLGLSRLTRTYREAAGLLLNEGVFAEEIEVEERTISLSYGDFERLKRKIEESDIMMENVEYGISVTLTLLGNDKMISAFLETAPSAQLISSKKKKTKRRIIR